MGRIIVIFLVIVAAIALYGWLAGGAGARIAALVPAFSNPLSTFFEAQKGQDVAYTAKALAPAVPRIGSSTVGGTSISAVHTPDAAAIERAKQFGQPSPSRGTVTFEPHYAYNVYSNTVQSEYVAIRASSQNTSPITLTGWSVLSAVSGRGSIIQGGVRTYRMGNITPFEIISLKPGEQAIVNSGSSPLGVSFHTNVCTGYLAQFQQFVPSLSNSCPTPASEMPNTLDNQRMYGARCIDFVKTLPSCSYYLGAFPDDISDSCRGFVSNALTYNSCIDRHQWQPGFNGNTWRIYLGSNDTLWNHAHDVIRLLDASGRTVDVLSY